MSSAKFTRKENWECYSYISDDGIQWIIYDGNNDKECPYVLRRRTADPIFKNKYSDHDQMKLGLQEIFNKLEGKELTTYDKPMRFNTESRITSKYIYSVNSDKQSVTVRNCFSDVDIGTYETLTQAKTEYEKYLNERYKDKQTTLF